jgi:hypothetical protein
VAVERLYFTIREPDTFRSWPLPAVPLEPLAAKRLGADEG